MLGVSLLMTLVVHLFRTTVNATSTEVSYATCTCMCAAMIILYVYIDMHTMTLYCTIDHIDYVTGIVNCSREQ